MTGTVVLCGVPVDLDSDMGRRFTVDACRAGEGLLSDKELAEAYEISPPDWQAIIKNAALGRAIRAERERRVLNGTAARESAAKHFVKAPTILDRIMTDEQSNARHKIESIKELRQIATPESPNSPSHSERFVIRIDLTAGGGGDADVHVFNKSIAINPNDTPPDEQPKLPERPKLTLLSNEGFESDE